MSSAIYPSRYYQGRDECHGASSHPSWGSAWRRGVSCMASCPGNYFRPCSTLLYSAEGELLGARIAPDGQWRFPAADSLPDKFVDCLLTYEDNGSFTIRDRPRRHLPGRSA